MSNLIANFIVDELKNKIDKYLEEIAQTKVNTEYDKGMIEGAEHYLLQLKKDIEEFR